MEWRNFSTEYKQMSVEDQKTFRHWLVTNTVIGAASVVGLILITSVLSDNRSNPVAAQTELVLHARAK